MADLATWLERKKMRQKDLAEEVGVGKSAVSKWVRKGLPDDRIEDVAKVLDIDPTDLTPDRSGEYVQSDDALSDWHTAVSTSSIDPHTSAIIGSFAVFLDKVSWVSVFQISDLVERTGWDKDEVWDRWDDILDSPFVERVGDTDVQWVFRLKFPKNE